MFFKYLTISENIAVLFIWKVTSRPLIWTPFECYFIYLKWRYGIFKFFSIFFNFLLAYVSQALSFQPLDRIQFSNAHFFCFLMRNTCLKKIWADLLFWPFLGNFSYIHFFLIFNFFCFYNIAFSIFDWVKPWIGVKNRFSNFAISIVYI